MHCKLWISHINFIFKNIFAAVVDYIIIKAYLLSESN